MRDYKEQYRNLPQEVKDRMNWKRGKFETSVEQIFVENSTLPNERIKDRALKEQLLVYKCYECSLVEWNGKVIVLELDHINGNNKDHRLENLRLLCPNCHSQTSTFRGKNINTGKLKVTNEELLKALQEQKNIRSALISVGLAPKGANYLRCEKLLHASMS